MIRVPLARVGLLAIVSVLIIDGSGGGLIGSSAQAAGGSPAGRACRPDKDARRWVRKTNQRCEGRKTLQAGLRSLGSQM
jgi:hypothetical protein